MPDYSDLIEKVKMEIIPKNIKNKRRRDDVTGDFYNVQSIQVSQLAKYKLTDEELSFVISFLAQENIEVAGTIPDFCWDNDGDNYMYLRSYRDQKLPRALKQEEILSLYERKKKLENINTGITDLERKQANEDIIKDIREKLILGNMRLARWCATSYYINLHKNGEQISEDEIQQMAYEALIRTVDHYDFTSGIAFSSYAIPRIKGGLYNYFRRYKYTVNSIVKVSDYKGLELNKVIKTINLLRQSGKIDDKDIKKFTIENINSIVESLGDSSLDIPKIHKDLNLLYVINNSSSLDVMTSDEIDKTEDFSSPVEDIVIDTMMKEDINKSLETLTDVERFVLLRRYGFVDDVIKTRPQIVEALDKSGLRKDNCGNSSNDGKFSTFDVCLAESKGLRKMRQPKRRKRLQDYA